MAGTDLGDLSPYLDKLHWTDAATESLHPWRNMIVTKILQTKFNAVRSDMSDGKKKS